MANRASSRSRKFVWLEGPLLVAVAISMGALSPLSAQTDNDTAQRAIYNSSSEFDKLSGMAQTLLGIKFGNIAAPRALQPADNAAALSGEAPPVDVIPTNVLVNNPAVDATIQDTQSETSIVLGSGSVVLVGYNDSGSFIGTAQFTGWSRSTDGGLTFTDMGKLPLSANGDAGDPVLARDTTSGKIYFATLAFSGSAIQVFRSTDNGATFTAPVNAAPGTSGFQDKCWITVDNFPGPGQGNVYVVFRDFGPGNAIKLTKSTDGGATYAPSGGTVIASGSPVNVQGAFVTVGPDHSVYVIYFDQNSLPETIKVRRSTDLGVTFGAPVTVSTLNGSAINGDLSLNGGFRSNSFPHATVNPVNGDVYVVYNTCTSSPCTAAADHADAFFRRSTDHGATWSAAIKVNDDGTTRDQFMPTIGVTPDGANVLVTWYDRRNSPTNTLIDRFASIGVVSGGSISFGANFQITSASFPVAIGMDPVVNPTYMGDYDQAVADSTGFYVTWGDNRLPHAPFHANQPDVRFAKVALVSPSITKAFGAASIPLSGSTSLTFTITNPNTDLTLTGVAFTDSLPAGLTVASTPNLTNTCGGTATAVGGSGTISLSGGTLATSASCTISVSITGTTPGVKNNSVTVTSTNAGTGNTSNASITVVGPPTISKAFGTASMVNGSHTSLTFTITNPNSFAALTGVGFSDTLPAGLLVATPNGLTGSCGGGTITAVAGSVSISLSGATLAASASCTFSVSITSTAGGVYLNTTSAVTSANGGAGGAASAGITITCVITTVHGHVVTTPPDGHDGDSHQHKGQHFHHLLAGVVCLPIGHHVTVNGHILGLTPESGNEAIPSALTREPDFVSVLNQDGLNRPAAPGTIVQFFGSARGLFLDLADLRPALEFTPSASGSPLYYTEAMPDVQIGGVKAEVLFSGLAPGLKGVWQINVRIPDGARSGKVPVTIVYEGDALTSVDLAVQ